MRKRGMTIQEKVAWELSKHDRWGLEECHLEIADKILQIIDDMLPENPYQRGGQNDSEYWTVLRYRKEVRKRLGITE
jgi:hypothetical protein